jgi:transcriptional regulator with XRE-family HTH domain
MDVIGKVRRMRERAGLSEREIARRMGISRNTVSKWLGDRVVQRFLRYIPQRSAASIMEAAR